MNRFTLTRRGFVAGTAASTLAAPMIMKNAAAAELPRTMVWTAYDLGSTGHAEASAVADAFINAYGTRIRILPSGTSIGRIVPVTTGRATYGWLANEVYFAAEAIYDFADLSWGPQDLRVVAGRDAAFGVFAAADAEVASVDDLRGKRVAYIEGNPSVNIKVEAVFAFAGITWDDVERIEFPGYGASLRGVIEGRCDAAGASPTAGLLRELEASPRGITWTPLPRDNDAGWEALRGVAPFFKPVEETLGAGIPEGGSVALMAYKYPMITTLATTSEDEVYNLAKALDSQFDAFKGATGVMPRWKLADATQPPADAPFHDGMVRYLTEKGMWTDEHEAWNTARLARMKAVQAAWAEAVDEADAQQIKGSDYPEFWAEFRAKAL